MSLNNITRRNVLLAAAVVPLRAATSAPSPVMTRLSSYMSEAGGKALPEEALEKTRQHIIDTFAAMM